MFNWLFPSKPPSPSEWAVLFWGFVVLLILAGLTGLTVSFFAPAEKHELAVQLAHHSIWLVVAGVILGVVTCVVRRFID